jgi:hypothetical protein
VFVIWMSVFLPRSVELITLGKINIEPGRSVEKSALAAPALKASPSATIAAQPTVRPLAVLMGVSSFRTRCTM